MHKPFTIRRAAPALALAGVALAAAAPSQAEVVKFGSASYSSISGQILAASLDPEIFGAHGIALELVDLRGSSVNCLTALISASVDVCQVGTTTGMDAIAEGAPLKAVAVVSGPTNEVILSAKTADTLGVAPDAPVADRLRALAGLRIASAPPGSAHHTTLAYMLGTVGLSVADLQFQPLVDTVAMMESIRHDQLDGALWSAGDLGGLLSDNSGIRWPSIPRGDVPELATLPYVTAYVRADWAEENPDLAEAVHNGLADAIARIDRDDGTMTEAIRAEYFPELDRALWEDGIAEARKAAFENAQATKAGWDMLLELQAASTGKDYGAVAFETVVLPFAIAD